MFESETTESLKSRVQRMSEQYLKGMGDALVGGICDFAYANRLGVGDGDQWALARDAYQQIASFYVRIPFEELVGNADFAPLFAVRDLLPRFKTAMDEAFSHPSQENTDALTRLANEIVDHGFRYDCLMNRLLRFVQTERDEGFRINLVDCHGKQWTF